ncbi:hypothetical protein HETIRDRAFT_434572 [Heterobasidion irregulare TC 32-1]|uniref:U3 small nucleolar RNA-associated protein 25 n=1 Tax=Heterobasidion irregulare (strain TC 32-1) TaxID=747525 RepID=W4K5Z7_HETIT|nr:uncharacterized protein HETIRDRAFT_434572 [Heterobasidion irregulare TC 32-1]ETW80476.1 hypothetical protein HETIRDRAFT_434572 [Heterobasidion irregulare TC 32-1]
MAAFQDTYEAHFGAEPSILTELSRESVDKRAWTSSNSSLSRLGTVIESFPAGTSKPELSKESPVLERLRIPFNQQQARLPSDLVELQNNILSVLPTYRDLYYGQTSLETVNRVREATSLHVLSHVTKKRRRVLKNNERLAHASKNSTTLPENVQDQGFTRPSVLILLPFRSSALRWLEAIMTHTPAPNYQVENLARFRNEFGLPEGSVDKLATAEPGTYPRDHVETFKGNMDDSFRVGIKLTRKSVKLFSEFYASDIILASPLGLRLSIEKNKNADFLSSIEILIFDQMDVVTMQNWEHVEFVLSHMNKLPKDSHDTDFSRIKPWYLDGHAAYLRQSILFSTYETPETRSLFNQSLKNVAGKMRTVRHWSPVEVPEDLDQKFVQFDCSNIKDEPDKRFTYFITQILPTILKSAVQSANTVIFIPSYFDFIRVRNHFRKSSISFTVLSEDSTNQDISRARQAFFTGKRPFLLVTERFHFYRRYKIRGIRNLVFFGPPDHAQFYAEFLSYPFLDEDVEPSDVTSRVLYSKFDWFRLERIVGTKGATQLIRNGV